MNRVSSVVASLRAGVSPVCEGVVPGADEFGILALSAITSGDVSRKHAKRLEGALVKDEWPFIRKGTILVSRASGSRDLVGACVLVEKDEPKLVPPDTAWVVEVADGHSARALIEYLRSPKGRKAIHEIARGSNGTWKISQESFLSIRLPNFNETTERRVDSLSTTFDGHISGLDALIKERRKFKHGLAQQLLTGKTRFPEFEKSSDRQTGEFGTLPADWSVVSVSKIASESSVRGATDGAIVYSCTKHNGLVPSLEYFGKQVFSRNLNAYKRLAAGDFVYATNHIEEGSIGLLRVGQKPGLVSPMYTVFHCSEVVNPEFLFSVLKTESYRRVFEKRTSSSVERRGSLRWNEFSRILVPLPCRKEQDKIVSVLALLDSEIILLEKEREQFGLYKRELLVQLLSGETPVAA